MRTKQYAIILNKDGATFYSSDNTDMMAEMEMNLYDDYNITSFGDLNGPYHLMVYEKIDKKSKTKPVTECRCDSCPIADKCENKAMCIECDVCWLDKYSNSMKKYIIETTLKQMNPPTEDSD